MSYKLSTKQIKKYNEDGFVIIDNVIDEDFLNKVKLATTKIVEKASLINNSNDQYDLADNHSRSKISVRRIKQPHSFDNTFKDLLYYPSVIQKVKSLLGPNFRLHNGKINLKSPSAGDLVDWHQDWAFYPHSNDDVLAVGIMLDDMTSENGSVLFIPGSHKGKIYNHHHNGYFAGAIDIEKDNIDLSDAFEVTGKAGSITIHHARLLHASKPNNSNNMRRFLLWEFAASDAWPLMGINDYNDFNKKIISGKTINTPRLSNVPVIMPLPEAINQGSIFENQKVVTKNKNNILM
ncbi:phytanoyl-CoA dioxygenase family protein [Alphaproteobacteria bacterium]|nr:phytanoyl-CoA dioxygenase family protein [Alphaproteobacteria bacterium]